MRFEDTLAKKQIYEMMKDMVKDGRISGAQLIEICLSQLEDETDISVLLHAFKTVIPAMINSYMPSENYAEFKCKIFELAQLKIQAIKDSVK